MFAFRFKCGHGFSRRLHGRRGLKYAITDDVLPKGSVAAFTGGVD